MHFQHLKDLYFQKVLSKLKTYMPNNSFNRNRNISFTESINEAIDLFMNKNKKSIIMGLGINDPKRIFGTTKNLFEKYGKERCIETPTSENSMTAVAIGNSIMGVNTLLVHQRVEFSLLGFDQIVNQASKWFYMTDGRQNVPLTIRLIVGRGWGQGPQHAQNLTSVFSHIPGLKVFVPSTPYEAKGLLIRALNDPNPVIFYEHRWLHNLKQNVPRKYFESSQSSTLIKRVGSDMTIVSYSIMTIEALKVHEILKNNQINAEVIDLKIIKPLNISEIIKSVKKTGKLVFLEDDWLDFAIGSEIISKLVEYDEKIFQSKPIRIGFKNTPSPSSVTLAEDFYPNYISIIKIMAKKFNLKLDIRKNINEFKSDSKDIPYQGFTGPF